MNLLKTGKNYPSLVISEEKIQVILLDEKRERVLQLAQERLEPQVIVAGEVRDAQKLALSLRNLFKVTKISERFVVVGIPENKCYTKVLALPKLKADELAEAVSWEADTYLPVPTDQVYMDWKLIEEKNKDQVKILLIAAPREIIDGYTEALRLAGLVPVLYESTALSLVRLVESFQARLLVIELQQQHAVLTITEGKAIEASSVVSLSGEEGGEGLPYLLETIKTMLSYYEREGKNETNIAKIYLCGEGANGVVVKRIAEETNRSVDFCPLPLTNLPKEKQASFAVVASLAMKDVKSPKDEQSINLLPPRIQEELDRVKNQRANKTLLTVSSTIVVAVTMAALAAFIYLKSLETSLEQEKLALTPLPSEIGKIISQTQSLNRASTTINEIGKKRTFPQTRLATLLVSIPEGVKIVNISINEVQKGLRVSGRADTRSNLLKFKDNLEATGMFTEPILPLSSLQQSANIDFVLTATIK